MKTLLTFILLVFSSVSIAAIVPDKCLYLSWSEVTTNTDNEPIVVDRYSVYMTFEGVETTYDILPPETEYKNCVVEEGSYVAQVTSWEAETNLESEKSPFVLVTASIEVVEEALPSRIEITGHNLKMTIIDNPQIVEQE